MTVLLAVLGSLAGLCYFVMVVIVRALGAEAAARERAVRAYLDRRGTAVGAEVPPSEPGHEEALLAEAEQWPGWKAEYRRQVAAALQPRRGVLWAAVLVASVLAAIAVNLRFGDGSPTGDSLAATWPVLLFFVAPWFAATGAVDLADRLRWLARRGER